MRSAIVLLLLSSLALSGCGYRMIRADEIEVPNYEPRPVPVHPQCDALANRAASEGLARFTEVEVRTLNFCQQQHIIRAQEEEAAARRLEAHAAAANFALQATTVVVGALIAVLTWLF